MGTEIFEVLVKTCNHTSKVLVKTCNRASKVLVKTCKKQLSEQFKMYMLVGGMPNVENEYVKTNSLSKVLTLQKNFRG